MHWISFYKMRYLMRALKKNLISVSFLQVQKEHLQLRLKSSLILSNCPCNKALVCIHLSQRNDAFLANLITLKYKPMAVR